MLIDCTWHEAFRFGVLPVADRRRRYVASDVVEIARVIGRVVISKRSAAATGVDAGSHPVAWHLSLEAHVFAEPRCPVDRRQNEALPNIEIARTTVIAWIEGVGVAQIKAVTSGGGF